MYDAQNIFQTFQMYAGETVYLMLFLCSILYVYFFAGKENRKRILLLVGLSIFVIYNDISKKLLEALVPGTYYRFLWAIPMILVIAYVLVRILETQKKNNGKIVIFVSVAIMIFYSSNFLETGKLALPENKYGIPNDVIQVCDMIAEDKEVERPVVIFDYELQLSARTYDASFIRGISREAYLKYNDLDGYEESGELQDEMILIQAVNYGVQGEEEMLSQALEARNADYIVTMTSFGMQEYFSRIGYELVGTSDTRSVFRKES